RPARRQGRAASGAARSQAQDEGPVPLHRQGRHRAPRHPANDRGQGDLRNRREGSGRAGVVDRAVSGVRRQGGDVRRQRREGDQGCQPRRPGHQRHRRRRRQLLVGHEGPARAQGEVERGAAGQPLERRDHARVSGPGQAAGSGRSQGRRRGEGGRRGEPDFVTDAVETSKAIGGPVKIIWTREDDLQHGFYRPATYNVFKAALDAQGTPTAWWNRIVGPGILIQKGRAPAGSIDPAAVEGARNHPYDIPNILVEWKEKDFGVPIGFWRSVGSSQNAFITERFIDELDHAAGKDPYEYRRALLGNAT